jgi:phosphotransferase system HPr (HPr) family protein
VSDAGACEGEFTVQHKLGLHARPAGRFVALASRFQSEVEVTRSDDPGEWVNGRSVLSLLSLAASFGTRLRVRASGADAEKALATLGQVLEAPLEGDGG